MSDKQVVMLGFEYLREAEAAREAAVAKAKVVKEKGVKVEDEGKVVGENAADV